MQRLYSIFASNVDSLTKIQIPISFADPVKGNVFVGITFYLLNF